MNRSSCLTVGAAGRLPGASLLLAAFAIAVSLLPGVAAWLQYDRSALANGALWRIVTSHFVHWSAGHLFWDVLALGVLGWFCEKQNVERFLACVAASAVLIPLILWIAEPTMATYRGLSGIDSALFSMLAARTISEAIADKDWFRLALAGLVAAGFAAKVGFELRTGGTLFVDSAAAGMTPVPLVHVVGGLVGLACDIVPIIIQNNASSASQAALTPSSPLSWAATSDARREYEGSSSRCSAMRYGRKRY